MNQCTIDGCHKKRIARGWCHGHYGLWRRTGDPLTPARVNRISTPDLVEELEWLLDAGESPWQISRQVRVPPKAIMNRMKRTIPGVPDDTRRRILAVYTPLAKVAA